MNMMWVIEWWVRKTTIEWHYQSLSNCDTDMQEIHLLLMLDIIRDANWVKLGINEEVYNEVTAGVYTQGDPRW